MADLATLTAALARALTAPAIDGVPVDAFDGDSDLVRRRLRIYRGNGQANARKALEGAYPIAARIVGDSFFEGLANAFAAATPSTSGDLNEYGATLPAFLASFGPARSLRYLPDVAAMEWRVHCAHYAADAPPLDPAVLAAVPAQRYADLRWRLAPGVARVESRWPLARIFEVHQPDYDGALDVDLDAGGDRVLVYRPRFRVRVRALSPGAYAFVGACAGDRPLGAALAGAQAAEPGWRLDDELRALVADRVLTGFALD
jgi:hypothetical protein